MSRAKGTRIGIVAAALLLGAVLLVRLNEVALPEGPVEVVWDREVCAHFVF